MHSLYQVVDAKAGQIQGTILLNYSYNGFTYILAEVTEQQNAHNEAIPCFHPHVKAFILTMGTDGADISSVEEQLKVLGVL